MSLKLSRRRRSVVGTTGAFVILGIVTAVIIPRLTEPESAYVPGGEIEGLSARLSRELPTDHPETSFTDVAEAAGIVFRHFPGRRSGQLPEDMGSGAAWADYDNDGWLDLFLVNIAGPLPVGAGQPGGSSRLYRNLGDGTFRDVTDEAGIDHRTIGMAVAWADYDNDGWTDLFLTAFGNNMLYRNLGDGTFRDVTGAVGMGGRPGFWAGAAWSDYDLDGHLDLYVTGYVEYESFLNVGGAALQYDVEIPASLNPSSFRPHHNLLWHNEGDGTFREMAAAAGVLGDRGRGLGAVWADFDEDGWPDLYVANDVSDNMLYRNLGDGTFVDVSHRAAVADYRGAMGLAVGDWDGDEDLDLFITHWIAQENALFSNLGADLSATSGETVSLRFFDEADRLGLGQIALDYIGWGTSFFDYDNDGRPDLFVANGSTFQQDDAPHLLVPMRDQLFWNRGGEAGFYELSAVVGDHFTRELVGRGAAFGDYDRDGDVDIIVVNHGDSPALLRNEGEDGRAWIEIRLEGTESNRSAIGARTRVVAGAVVQTQVVGSQASYLSHNSLVLHFGLGEARLVDTLEVLWPGGNRQIWVDIPARRAVHLVEGNQSWREEWIAPGRDLSMGFWEHYRSAGRHRVAGRLAESATAYEAALALNPVHADALYYLGSARLAMREFAAAVDVLNRLVAVDPGSPRAYTQLGAIHACPDPGAPLDLSRAAEELQRAWTLNREQTGTLLWLGLVALLEDDRPAAREHFEHVLGSNPASVPANYLLGYVSWIEGHLDKAGNALAAAIASARPADETEIGLQEGDTRGSRPLFAAAMSCRWLENQLSWMTQSKRSGEIDTGARYRLLDDALVQARNRIH
ncbi:MAG: FG-GAP-like repeat-containing protein [Gemmatimonadota bacterium]